MPSLLPQFMEKSGPSLMPEFMNPSALLIPAVATEIALQAIISGDVILPGAITIFLVQVALLFDAFTEAGAVTENPNPTALLHDSFTGDAAIDDEIKF